MAKKKKKGPTFIRKGRKAVEAAVSERPSTFLKLTDGESTEIVPIGGVDEIISFDQHAFWLEGGNSPIFPCLQSSNCPGCILGHEPRFKAILVVLVKEESGSEPRERLLIFGKQVLRAFIDAEDAIGSKLNGHILRFSRKGSRLETRYSVVPTGRTTSVPDIEDVELKPIDYVGMTDRDEIIEALEEAGLWDRSGTADAFSDSADDDDESSDWDDEEFVVEDGD